MLGWRASALRLGLDIETHGFSTIVLTVALAPDEKTAYVVPIRHKEGDLPPVSTLKKICKRVLAADMTVVGQNVQFDLSRLSRASGLPIRCLAEDSMVYHYLLSEHSTTRNLDFLSRAYTKQGGYKSTVDSSQLAETPLDLVAQYNGTDAAITLEICERIKERLKAEGYWSDQVLEFYKRAIPFVATLEANGIKVDLEMLARVEKEQAALVEGLESELKEMAPGINFDSPQQLRVYLYQTLKIPVPRVQGAYSKTTGLPSTAKNVIKKIDHPYVRKLLEYRTEKKTLSTLLPQIRKAVEPDGICHPQYFLVKKEWDDKDKEGGGTVSGRLSAKNPPIQTITKGPMRRLFISRYPRGRLLRLDASQMELRLAAMLSGDVYLCTAFRNKADLHQLTATDNRLPRKKGKVLNLGGIYGLSIWGIEELLGCPKREATKIFNTMQKNWSMLFEFWEEKKKEVLEHEQIATPFGQWRRVPGLTDKKGKVNHNLLLSALNFLPQITGSHMNVLFGWWAERVLEGRAIPVASVHDEVVFDTTCPKWCVDTLQCNIVEYVQLVEEILLPLTIPFVFEAQAGKNWHDLEEIGEIST